MVLLVLTFRSFQCDLAEVGYIEISGANILRPLRGRLHHNLWGFFHLSPEAAVLMERVCHRYTGVRRTKRIC